MEPDPRRSAAPVPSWPRRDADHLLVTSAQMAALEERLFASGLPVEALMEKAALQVSRRLLERAEALRQGALVLVGPGHNGGDGLVVARELHLAGVPVRIWSPFERHRPLTEAHLRHADWLGIPRLERSPDPGEAALWIDALFGIGQHRPPPEAITALLGQRHQCGDGRLVAIDVPTGLCADTGRRLCRAPARASLTCCLGLLKRGLVQDTALDLVGRLERLDLGLPPALLADLPADTPLALGGGDRATAPLTRLPRAAAKYGRGRLLVIAGSGAYRGAALLSLLGASASGCGSLRAAVPSRVGERLWSELPQVVLEEPAEDGAGRPDLEALLTPARLERVDAVLLGPGIGGPAAVAEGPEDETLAGWAALQRFDGLLLLDADGLNRLAAGAAGAPLAWLQGRAGPTWLTPHAAEFARLFPALAEQEPLEGALAAARLSGAAVLLKGARSVVAAPDGRRWQLRQAAPEVARAGLGDVLAGYAAGRGAMAVAAGIGPEPALLAAAVLDHAAAGLAARDGEGVGAATPQAVAGRLAAARARPADDAAQADPWGHE